MSLFKSKKDREEALIDKLQKRVEAKDRRAKIAELRNQLMVDDRKIEEYRKSREDLRHDRKTRKVKRRAHLFERKTTLETARGGYEKARTDRKFNTFKYADAERRRESQRNSHQSYGSGSSHRSWDSKKPDLSHK